MLDENAELAAILDLVALLVDDVLKDFGAVFVFGLKWDYFGAWLSVNNA